MANDEAVEAKLGLNTEPAKKKLEEMKSFFGSFRAHIRTEWDSAFSPEKMGQAGKSWAEKFTDQLKDLPSIAARIALDASGVMQKPAFHEMMTSQILNSQMQQFARVAGMPGVMSDQQLRAIQGMMRPMAEAEASGSIRIEALNNLAYSIGMAVKDAMAGGVPSTGAPVGGR